MQGTHVSAAAAAIIASLETEPICPATAWLLATRPMFACPCPSFLPHTRRTAHDEDPPAGGHSIDPSIGFGGAAIKVARRLGFDRNRGGGGVVRMHMCCLLQIMGAPPQASSSCAGPIAPCGRHWTDPHLYHTTYIGQPPASVRLHPTHGRPLLSPPFTPSTSSLLARASIVEPSSPPPSSVCAQPPTPGRATLPPGAGATFQP